MTCFGFSLVSFIWSLQPFLLPTTAILSVRVKTILVSAVFYSKSQKYFAKFGGRGIWSIVVRQALDSPQIKTCEIHKKWNRALSVQYVYGETSVLCEKLRHQWWQSPPTALQPVTNINFSEECFVNLMVWLTTGAKNLAMGSKMENFLTTHPISTTKRFEMKWMKTFSFDAWKPHIWSIFRPPWAKHLAAGSKIENILNTHPIITVERLVAGCLFGLFVDKTASFAMWCRHHASQKLSTSQSKKFHMLCILWITLIFNWNKNTGIHERQRRIFAICLWSLFGSTIRT